MRDQLFKYLRKNFSQDPKEVDRLIFSSFITINDLKVKKNIYLKDYIISPDDVDEYINLNLFISEFKKQESEFPFETLIEAFEFVISPADRIVNGAVYTPSNIRNFIVDNSITENTITNENYKICDISCGCGGFLYSAAQKIKSLTNKSYYQIFKQNIYGLDIQEYSINRTKLLLSTLALINGEDVYQFEFNLFVGDALNFQWDIIKKFKGFDAVIGNPPYVASRNIDESTRQYLVNWEVCKTGHPDLYIPFFQIGIQYLKVNGVLGFITMNSFFKSLNGRALREYFIKHKLKYKIIDFGSEQLFNSRLTYTCICIIEKTESDFIEYTRLEKGELNDVPSFNIIPYTSLDAFKGWNLKNTDLINKIESAGKAFSDRYVTRNGIATLKNHLYIFDPIDEDDDYYYLQNGSLFQIEKGICKDILNPNKLASSKSIRGLKQKVIFPYEFETERAKVISENRFKLEYPKAYKYLNGKRDILEERDKGKGIYEKWFAFGRSQSLEKLKHKLFFPHITKDIPNYIINSDEDLLFYNGIAVIGNSYDELSILRKLMQSRLFWFYIVNSSKPYSSGYFSLSKNYIRNFGIYDFSKDDLDFIKTHNDEEELNDFFEAKYQIRVPNI